MSTILNLIQIVSAILLTLLILLQVKGAGLSETFGGSNTFYSQKRGPERILFVATIVMAVLFVSTSFLVSFI